MLGEDRSRPYRRFGVRGRAWRALGLVALFALPALGILALGTLAPSRPATAATGAELGGSNAPRRTAFVVGNSNYRSIATLANPSRDALAVAEALERVGFEVTRVIDGDRQTMAGELRRFAQASRGSDIVLFYYAGHGVQIDGENYLLPVSIEVSETESIFEQSISLGEVRDRLSEADPGLTLFILDSCRNNPFGPMPARSGGAAGPPLVIGQGMARMSGAAGLLIAYATEPGGVALDGIGLHSPFTAALLRHIEAPGLEIRLLLGRVREDVVANTAGRQVPWVEEAVLGEFYFTEPRFGDGERPIAGSGEHDLIFWRSVWRSTDASDYEAYLEQFPDGAFAALAVNRLKALRASASAAAMPLPAAVAAAAEIDAEGWRLIKNSLYWLGYYGGPLTGVRDAGVVGSIRALQEARYERPTGSLTPPQLRNLHDAAAGSLIALGERLAERIVFDRARLRSIDRGITDIALPAFRELEQRLAGKAEGAEILAEVKRQLDAMGQRRDSVARQFERASESYLTVVAAAGSGYAEQVRAASLGRSRAGGTERVSDRFLSSRRQLFLRHSLEYATKGRIDEELWVEQLR